MNTRSGHPDRRASLADLLRGCLTGDPLAEESRDGRFTFTASIPDGHPIYEGHFPRVAILPGAVELLLVELAATRAIGRPLRLARIASTKFARPIFPDQPIAIEGAWRTDAEGRVLVEAHLTCDGQRAAAMKMVFDDPSRDGEAGRT